jgi:hypothetical protein
MNNVISRVKNHKCAEGDLHPDTMPADFHQMVDFWRAAKRVLLLTPAPDQQAVAWKQRHLEGDKIKYLGIEAAGLKRAIAEDVTWLKAHPTRTKLLPKKRGRK